MKHPAPKFLKTRPLKALALIIPLLVLGHAVVQNELRLQTNDPWIVPITGFDPRDILRGRYITFAYDWNIGETPCQGDDCLLCLAPSQNRINPETTVITADTESHHCAATIPGRYLQNRFMRKANNHQSRERFYVPESHAGMLDRMLQDRASDTRFHIRLHINDNGEIAAEDLLIDDQPLSAWIADDPATEQ